MAKEFITRKAYGIYFYPQAERYSSCRKALEDAVCSVNYEHDWADVWMERSDRCVLIFARDEVQAKADEENEKRGIRVSQWNVSVDIETSAGFPEFRTHMEQVS